jgi:alpha-D-ribose 1-methylphosphonate 5-triphosphate synthase subunit PhnH
MTAFTEAAFASQAAFRALMDAFARPGEIRRVSGVPVPAPAPLTPTTAALLQTLADYETPVWLDASLAQPAVIEWIRFHTGAPVTDNSLNAAFALIGDARALPDFAQFSPGSDEYPDRSATLIVQIERFAGRTLQLQGPGIKTTRSLAAGPLPEDFVVRLAGNRELHPRGLDLVLVAGDQVAALPRSLRLTEA